MNSTPFCGPRRTTVVLVLCLLLCPLARAQGGASRTPKISALQTHATEKQLSLSLRIAEARHNNRVRRYLRCLLRRRKRKPAHAGSSREILLRQAGQPAGP